MIQYNQRGKTMNKSSRVDIFIIGFIAGFFVCMATLVITGVIG